MLQSTSKSMNAFVELLIYLLVVAAIICGLRHCMLRLHGLQEKATAREVPLNGGVV